MYPGATEPSGVVSSGRTVLAGYDATVRYGGLAETVWPVLIDGVNTGDQPPNNDVNFNRLHDYEEQAVGFQDPRRVNPVRHGVVCGNQVDGPTLADATQECPVGLRGVGESVRVRGGNEQRPSTGR